MGPRSTASNRRTLPRRVVRAIYSSMPTRTSHQGQSRMTLETGRDRFRDRFPHKPFNSANDSALVSRGPTVASERTTIEFRGDWLDSRLDPLTTRASLGQQVPESSNSLILGYQGHSIWDPSQTARLLGWGRKRGPPAGRLDRCYGEQCRKRTSSTPEPTMVPYFNNERCCWIRASGPHDAAHDSS